MIRILFIIALVYWFLATLALLDIMFGEGMLFGFADIVLMPGYLLGFALGYGGGTGWALLGQLIPLALILGLNFLLKKITNKQTG